MPPSQALPVRIREYTPADLDALRRMHASQGFDYPFPDLSDPIFISKLIVEDDDGRPVMASLARLTCEMYLLIDREPSVRHSERSDRTVVCLPEGTSGRAGEESLFGSASPGWKRDPSSPSRASASAEESQAARDSAQDDAIRARGHSGEAQGLSPVKKDAPQALSSLPQAAAEAETPERQGVAARERWAQILALHRAGELDLLARGLDDAHAWLPPPIAKRFGRRLASLGWLRDDSWTPYCKRLKP